MKKLKDNLAAVIVLTAGIASMTILTAMGKPVPGVIAGIVAILVQAFLPALTGGEKADPPGGDAS